MKYYNNDGIKYLSIGDYENAESYLLKSLEIKKVILSETDRRLGNVYVNLGVLYQNTWRFDQAIENFRLAEEIYRRIDSNYIDLGSLYVNEAIVFRILGDYNKAKQFCNNIALTYTELGNIELAKKYYLLALNLSEKINGKDSPDNAQYLLNYGIFLIERQNQEEEGFQLYEKALEMFLKKYGLNHTYTSHCYHNIGEYYLKINDYYSALNNFQKSLIAAEISFTDTSIYSNPTLDQQKINFRILETLKKKAETFLLLFKITGNIKFLNESLKVYELALEIIDSIRL